MRFKQRQKIQEEAKTKKNNNKKKNNKTDNNNKNKDGTYPPCPPCKKTNHPQRKCWWKPNVKCRKCGQIGHMERICKSQQHEEAKASTEQHQEEQLFVATCFTTSNSSSDSVKGKRIVAIESLIGLKYITDVLYVPDIDQNLLSVGQLIEKGFKVIFEDKWCMIKDAKETEFGERCAIVEDKLADSVACQYGKQTRRPFPQTAWRAMHKLQLVHTDVGGPQKTPSLNGSNMVENQSSCRMQKIRSDNGKEYTNEIFDKFCEEAGIEHQLTTPYSPQQNGVSNSSKAYRIFQPQNGKILVSRDVKFMEDRQWNWEESIKMQLPEPAEFEEAEKDDKWIEAMKEELRMIEKNDTWELVDRPQHRKVIGVKWVYRTKLNADGSVNKYKARLVVKGTKGWKTYQLDVKSAFLNGYLQEEIYVEQPEGFQVKGQEEKVYLLKKALYGLKQAPRAWYSRIDEHLQSLGFVKSPSEATLYVKGTDANLIVVSVYVDDLLVTDLGLMSYFLGMEVKQDHDGVFISQKKYAKEILNKFHMEDCKRTSTPMNQKEKFSKDDGAEKVDESQYRMKCIFKLPKGLFYYDMRSTTGFCFSFGSGIFSWSSKKQDVIAQSTAEAEYVAANATTKHFKIKLYHLREEQKDGEVKLLYCKTEDQIADVLTKALPKARFETLRSKIGLCNY
ncbi:Retrovirus-related Pol polyprotein from transposon TNT 1-94 [Vitis vinifera]|uniref:Retrovirus-related Pol polyprotein from transposon TNT 1-94 n=1 Tax=Vitis vinifera TaxID=29760 RepID=A0A438HRM4_VITVI|nr:Retrovirus-related Pol polyprotein from transposon TNT 1-94 [Vitis vinifera]